jgi:hypothetical protein
LFFILSQFLSRRGEVLDRLLPVSTPIEHIAERTKSSIDYLSQLSNCVDRFCRRERAILLKAPLGSIKRTKENERLDPSLLSVVEEMCSSLSMEVA